MVSVTMKCTITPSRRSEPVRTMPPSLKVRSIGTSLAAIWVGV
jgi:hypothetical protein